MELFFPSKTALISVLENVLELHRKMRYLTLFKIILCSAFRFIFMQIKLIFIRKVARRLGLKQRHRATQKWQQYQSYPSGNNRPRALALSFTSSQKKGKYLKCEKRQSPVFTLQCLPLSFTYFIFDRPGDEKSHCSNATLETRRKLGRVSSSSHLWDRYWGQYSFSHRLL